MPKEWQPFIEMCEIIEGCGWSMDGAIPLSIQTQQIGIDGLEAHQKKKSLKFGNVGRGIGRGRRVWCEYVENALFEISKN